MLFLAKTGFAVEQARRARRSRSMATIEIQSGFSFEADGTADVLLQFEAAHIPEQRIHSHDTTMSDVEHCARVAAQDDIGERLWIRTKGMFEVEYTATVEPDRHLPDLAKLEPILPHDMPGEAVQYLFDSRFCQATKFQNVVRDLFGDRTGGALIIDLRDWIAENFEYTPGASGPDTDATDSFISRRGICRDYAHVMVALARAAQIPARYVACYSPGVEPPDFHAVAEVFLNDPDTDGGGTWQLVDATGMATPQDIAKIGVGRDAADVSFMSSFGATEFKSSTVKVSAKD